VLKISDSVPRSWLYQRRWGIEDLFHRLESVLSSEIRSSSQPRATLLAFGVVALAYNVLSVIATAVRTCHELEYAGTGSVQEERLCCRTRGTTACLNRACHQGGTWRLIPLKGAGFKTDLSGRSYSGRHRSSHSDEERNR
jgi:hypothetical protein